MTFTFRKRKAEIFPPPCTFSELLYRHFFASCFCFSNQLFVQSCGTPSSGTFLSVSHCCTHPMRYGAMSRGEELKTYDKRLFLHDPVIYAADITALSTEPFGVHAYAFRRSTRRNFSSVGAKLLLM